MRFKAYLNGAVADESHLRAYLLANKEWTALEFKEAKNPPKLGLRKSVAAFANTEGGDLFLGVDNGGTPQGTGVDTAILTQILHQTGAPEAPDFTTNLVEVVSPPVRISLAGRP